MINITINACRVIRKHSEMPCYKQSCVSPEEIADLYRQLHTEVLYDTMTVLYLNLKNELIGLWEAENSMETLAFNPKDIYKNALLFNSAVIVIVKGTNHIEPEREDIQDAQRLAEFGRIVEIPCLDYINVSEKEYVSFCERGYL